MPLIISWPDHIEAGKVEKRYVSATDILPTLTQIAGIDLQDKGIDGINLLEPQEDRLLVWKWQKTFAARKGKWKLTNTKENHWKSKPSDQYIAPLKDDLSLKLFDLENDPGERVDLASTYPEKVKELEQAYQNWCAKNIQTKEKKKEAQH